MSPTGVPDPLYVLARRVLLDALDALGPQREAVILVGAQAVYLHTGPAGLAVPEYTTDADIALNPAFLAEAPKLEKALEAAGFHLGGADVGRWVTRRALQHREVEVVADLLVPEAVGGSGRRGARLGAHGNRAARKVRGLEAALVDQQRMAIASLEDADQRRFTVPVAGPAALLVAKLHKIAEREGDAGRAQDKDVLDVLRLLRTTALAALGQKLKGLREDKVAGPVTREVLAHLERLFGKPGATGSQMAARATAPLESVDTTAGACTTLTRDLIGFIR